MSPDKVCFEKIDFTGNPRVLSVEDRYVFRRGTHAEIAHLKEEAERQGAGQPDPAKFKRDVWIHVVEDSGEIIGCAFIVFLSAYRVRLNGIYLKERYQGLGLGKVLIQREIEDCRNSGVQTIEANSRHVELFRRMGFKSTGKVFTGKKWFKGHGEQFVLDLREGNG